MEIFNYSIITDHDTLNMNYFIKLIINYFFLLSIIFKYRLELPDILKIFFINVGNPL
jgi:hypothetical protein